MKAAVLFVLLAIAVLASAQSPEELEYQRKLKEYQDKKAIYDNFQAVANVPVQASNDLVSKLAPNQIPPGYAEQLLPTYTGIPVQFSNLGGPVIVPEPVPETTPAAPPVTAPTVPVPTAPKIRAATPLRPGPQNLQFNGAKRQASSNLFLRSVAAPGQAQGARGATRPTGLLFFTNANIQLPSLAQRLTQQSVRSQPVATRSVRAPAPRLVRTF